MLDGLLCYKLLLFVPFHGAHYAGPDYSNDNGFWDVVFFHLLLDIQNYILKWITTGHLFLKFFLEFFRAPMVCWFRTYSESSFKPASVKYFVKCSTLCLLAGKSSISLLSMLTFRRLAATALISFSFIHDLKSFTAKAAETPVEQKSLLNKSGFQQLYLFISTHRIIHFIPKLPSATKLLTISLQFLYHWLVIYFYSD